MNTFLNHKLIIDLIYMDAQRIIQIAKRKNFKWLKSCEGDSMKVGFQWPLYKGSRKLGESKYRMPMNLGLLKKY